MKALTLWQPWASLVALGVKTIETRSWSTSYRGPLAIHAAKKRPIEVSCQDVGEWQVLPDGGTGFSMRHTPTAAKAGDGQRLLGAMYPAEIGCHYGYRVLPLGAVVATCTLVDVVATESITWIPDGGIAGEGRWGVGDRCAAVEECQRSYGDFTPGRFAWLLADVEPLAEPVPAKGRQGLWEWTS